VPFSSKTALEKEPAAMLCALPGNFTSTSAVELATSSLPSWPLVLSPTDSTEPFSRSARMWFAPIARSTTGAAVGGHRPSAEGSLKSFVGVLPLAAAQPTPCGEDSDVASGC
jgi:hypothetical protein